MNLSAAILYVAPYTLRLLLWRTPSALAITVVFAICAYLLRGVTKSGAVAGAIVTFLIFLSAGMPGFLAVLTVFVLTATATQVGYARKLQLGTAEHRTGRSAQQVFANLLAATLVALPALFVSEARNLLMIGMCAALAEAAADTVSSELGQAFGPNAYLITNFQPAIVGSNGAISLIGTICGLLAGTIVCLACWWLRLISPAGFLIALLTAILGMFFDSLLGATLERPSRLDNNSVNYLSTIFTACLALLAAMLFT